MATSTTRQLEFAAAEARRLRAAGYVPLKQGPIDKGGGYGSSRPGRAQERPEDGGEGVWHEQMIFTPLRKAEVTDLVHKAKTHYRKGVLSTVLWVPRWLAVLVSAWLSRHGGTSHQLQQCGYHGADYLRRAALRASERPYLQAAFEAADALGGARAVWDVVEEELSDASETTPTE